MKNLRFILFVFVLTLAIPAVQAQKSTINDDSEPKQNVDLIRLNGAFPSSIGVVNDFEGVFSFSQIKELTKVITDFQKKTKHQIVIVTVDSIAPYQSIGLYAAHLSNTWDVGRKGFKDGLTVVMSENLHKIFIATDDETQKVLSDEYCDQVLQETILPAFKQGDYYDGLEEGLTRLMKRWEGHRE